MHLSAGFLRLFFLDELLTAFSGKQGEDNEQKNAGGGTRSRGGGSRRAGDLALELPAGFPKRRDQHHSRPACAESVSSTVRRLVPLPWTFGGLRGPCETAGRPCRRSARAHRSSYRLRDW